MNYYESNLTVLEEYRPFLKSSLEEVDDISILQGVDESGMWRVAIRQNEYDYYLTSRYNVEEEALRWAKSVKIDDNRYKIALVFGMADCVYIEKLHELYPENIILVYEPWISVFQANMQNRDMTSILKSDQIFICAGEAGKGTWIEYLAHFVRYMTRDLAVLTNLPSYRNLFQKQYLEWVLGIQEWRLQLGTSRNTMILFTKERTVNYLRNLRDVKVQHTGYDLVWELVHQDLIKRPAIVVAAGPSLDKNIHELKAAKNKAFIIAVDTALKSLMNAGIVPDLAVTVDPHKPMSLFEHETICELPWLVDITFNSELMSIHNGKRFYYVCTEPFVEAMMDKYDKNALHLESGGSVACIACSFAVRAGFPDVILVGQDLAYVDKKMHTEGAYNGDESFKSWKKYYEVEDIYGNMVLTEENMNGYRKWFEGLCARSENTTIYDATEGGAKINGTVICKLKDVIEEKCKDFEEFDFAKLIDGVEPCFTKEQQMEIEEYFQTMPELVTSMQKKLEEGLITVANLRRMSSKPKAALRRSCKEVMDLFAWLGEEPCCKLLDLYNYAQEYLIQERVYQDVGENSNEIIEIANLGKELFESYLKAIEEFRKELPLLMGEKE